MFYKMSSDNKEGSFWEERETCWVSSNIQCTPAWKAERIGRIPASLISEVCGRANYGPAIKTKEPEELAEIICGIREKSFKPDNLLAMEDGIVGEPLVRNWYSDEVLHRPITQVGTAVWKKDLYFSASLDGETKTDEGKDAAIEIKIPGKLNKKFIEVYESWGKELSNPHPETYIFASHYDQMTAGSVITNKDGCYYVVACLKDSTCFYQYIKTDIKLWETELYPKALEFHTTYVLPLLQKNNIQVIMPK